MFEDIKTNIIYILVLILIVLTVIAYPSTNASTARKYNKIDNFIPHLALNINNTETNEKENNQVYNTSVYKKNDLLIKLQEVVRNKKISILGDSISTYEGYSNDYKTSNSTIKDNLVYYDDTLFVNKVNSTWWKKTINRTSMNLLVNNSSAGDSVYGNASKRGQELHNNIINIYPDIIAIYIGINDIKDGISLEVFTKKYTEMIDIISDKYNEAELFLFTHIPYTCEGVARSNITDDELEKFNEVIREIAENKDNCNIVDLYKNSGINSKNYKNFMRDNALHPNTFGMNAIAETFIEALIEKYV